MSDNDMTIGRYLNAARLDAGLTLRQLAEAADLQLTVVARLLRDEITQPRPTHLLCLARSLELRESDVFLIADVPIPDDMPTVEALLRTEYDLPEEAVAEATKQIDAIVAQHRASQKK